MVQRGSNSLIHMQTVFRRGAGEKGVTEGGIWASGILDGAYGCGKEGIEGEGGRGRHKLM